MTVSIRLGGPDDLAAAANIYAAATQARREGRAVEEWRLAEVRDELANPEAWLFIAEVDGAQVAMASAAPSRHDKGAGDLMPGLCYLGFVFVMPDWWGRGVGSRLLDVTIAEAVNRGFTHMHLWTHENNERAHAIYLRRGFTRTGQAHPSGNDPDINVEEWERDL